MVGATQSLGFATIRELDTPTSTSIFIVSDDAYGDYINFVDSAPVGNNGTGRTGTAKVTYGTGLFQGAITGSINYSRACVSSGDNCSGTGTGAGPFTYTLSGNGTVGFAPGNFMAGSPGLPPLVIPCGSSAGYDVTTTDGGAILIAQDGTGGGGNIENPLPQVALIKTAAGATTTPSATGCCPADGGGGTGLGIENPLPQVLLIQTAAGALMHTAAGALMHTAAGATPENDGSTSGGAVCPTDGSGSAGNVENPFPQVSLIHTAAAAVIQTAAGALTHTAAGATTTTAAFQPIGITPPWQLAPVNYAATATCPTLPSGSCWLTLPTPTGTIPAFTTTTIEADASSGTLAPGLYPANVAVSLTPVATPTATPVISNTQAMLIVGNGTPLLQLSESAIAFRAAGTHAVLLSSSGASISYTAAASTLSGVSWLSVSPNTGSVASGSPVILNVTASPTGLAAGSYFGRVDIALPGL